MPVTTKLIDSKGCDTMPKEIFVLGLQRSGNHAIIAWLVDALSDRGQVYIFDDFFNPVALADREPQRLLPETKTVIVNVEDCTVADSKEQLDRAVADGYLPIGRDPTPTLVVILRDPFNLFASRGAFQQQCQLGNVSKAAIACWKDHARWSLDGGAIFYNQWCKSAFYRDRIAAHFGCTSNDLTIDRVPQSAGGSSFDGMTFDGSAAAMQTEQRWHWFRQHCPEWQTIDDPEVHELTRVLFPEVWADVTGDQPCPSPPD